MVIAGITAAVFAPVPFLVLLALFVLLAIWLLPKIWRGVKMVFARLKTLFGGKPAEAEARPSELFNPKLLKGGESAAEPPR